MPAKTKLNKATKYCLVYYSGYCNHCERHDREELCVSDDLTDINRTKDKYLQSYEDRCEYVKEWNKSHPYPSQMKEIPCEERDGDKYYYPGNFIVEEVHDAVH